MSNYILSSNYSRWKPKSKGQFIKLATLASLMHLILMIVGYKRLMSILYTLYPEPANTFQLPTEADIKKLKRAVNPNFKRIRKSKYILANCLSSSLLLWWILKKHGLDTSLIIGSSIEKGNQFKAHAWLEYKQFPLNENKRVRTKYHVFKYDFSNINIL